MSRTEIRQELTRHRQHDWTTGRPKVAGEFWQMLEVAETAPEWEAAHHNHQYCARKPTTSRSPHGWMMRWTGSSRTKTPWRRYLMCRLLRLQHACSGISVTPKRRFKPVCVRQPNGRRRYPETPHGRLPSGCSASVVAEEMGHARSVGWGLIPRSSGRSLTCPVCCMKLWPPAPANTRYGAVSVTGLLSRCMGQSRV